ncbi:MAG: S8 family serine peptidase [Chitinophagaceae bacterium]
MKFSGFVPFCLCLILLTVQNLHAQLKTESLILQNASTQRFKEEEVNFKKILEVSKTKGWPLMITQSNGSVGKLVGIDPLGYPLYISVDNNIRSAATIRTNLLWPGGSTGLALSGSAASLKGKIAMWDGGKIRDTHVEFTGRIVFKDNASVLDLHATHVAGTLIAAGINPLAKGMAFGAQQLLAYDFNQDGAEMLSQASNLLTSNHSYGTIAGWSYNSDSTRWEFYGRAESVEDYKLGYYSETSSLFDSIAYNAPNYLIVTSAGNKRSENGPAVGQPYYRFDANNRMVASGARPAGISSNDGYDIMTDRAAAKNVLAVGSIAAIPNGFSITSDAVLSSFSSWGPTDDGRIKPDVVANGENLLSSISTGDNDYGVQSGTSMSSPSATGSLFLLQEYYSRLHGGAFLRAATVKGLVIHTADDAGNAGPDYQYGWGVINMERAASVITSNNTDQAIYENTLANGASFSLPVIASGKGPLTVTLSWTDPKGVVESVNVLNNPAKKLINDLDIRIKKGTDIYMPFVLDPANPSALATKGDNITDNLEKIILGNTVAGDAYTIVVTHKGTLQRGQQAYSLIISGLGTSAYCSSAAASTAGARIDSVSIAGTGLGSAAGCTSYSARTGTTFPIEPGQTVPYFVRVSSCDASAVSKIIKIYVDYNNDGDFLDAGEAIAQSPVINGAGTFSGNFLTPASLVRNGSLLMRVIVQETANAADITPCGTYARGETQDYSLKIVTPSTDLGVTDVISPESSICGNVAQYVTVKLTNFGTATRSNIPVTCVIKNGATTIATINSVYIDTLLPQASKIYTIPTSFNAQPGNTYTITVNTNLVTDQNIANNAFATTATVSTVAAPAAGTAEICGTTAVLKTTASGSNIVSWYTSPTATTALASGSSATTTTIPANKTYYLSLNEVPGRAGLANRSVNTTTGGYSAVTALMTFKNDVPLTIENVRLYVGNPGKVTIIVGDSVKIVNNQITWYPLGQATLDAYSTLAQNPTNDTGAIFTLNIPVSKPGEHTLFALFEGSTTLYRNNGFAATPYPLNLPGIITLTGNNQAAPGSFYYYFYDMGIKLANCPTTRMAVLASTTVAPSITLAGNVLTSSLATGNQWFQNGSPIAGATGQTFTATTSGVYKSVLTSSSCGQLGSNEVNFAATPVVDINGTEIALIASPNPNKGEFFLQFEVKGKDDLRISMMNGLGQNVYSKTYPAFTGRFAQQIKPTGKVSPGMYLLRIEHNKKVYVKKMLVE